MQREVATTQWDLPHAYVEVSAQFTRCKCDRERAHALHHAKLLPEQAAAKPTLVTEKGT